MLSSKLLLQLFLTIFSFVSISESFLHNTVLSNNRKYNRYYMSMSDKYLNNLQNRIQSNKELVLDTNLLYSVPIANQTDVYPENMYVNINKMQSIFFNKKSTSIIFTSSRNLEDVYLYSNKTLSKVSDTTKISCKNVKTFVITDLKDNIDVILS